MSEAWAEDAFKPVEEMTYYEVLEVPRDASGEEVERAYRVALATYGEGSLAAYSVYGSSEVSVIRERVEEAYRVLSEPEGRRAYDAEIGGLDPVAASVELALRFDDEREDIRRSPDAVAPEIEAFDDVEEECGDYDGPRLRRARLRRGIAIEKIAAVTKINPTYLRFIEEEQFQDLPAAVYVRGFVTAYARCIGLDPARAVPDYMRRLEEARPSSRPRRRGRRGRS
jgi:flagellar biosynthesis protein FlhG